MVEKRTLVINIPVIHQGFLDLLKKNKNTISEIYIIEPKTVRKITGLQEEIASIDYKTSKKILTILGFNKIFVFNSKITNKFKKKKLLLINDQISRGLAQKIFSGLDIKWSSTFLRWDAQNVLAEKPLKEKKSLKEVDKTWMREAYKESKKSGDWWRQVGAVLVKDGEVILKAYNESLPSDYTPYQVGNIRDYVKAGEKQELSSTIHSEQRIISEAAQKGISLGGTSLYITHFPCPVCTKLIIFSGIKHCFFSEGASNLSGEKLLKLYGVKLLEVNI